MPALRELQIGFAASLTNREAAARFAGGVRAVGLAPERRLQVYRNNHFASLTEVLAAVYPVVRRLVGEAFFDQAARAYIATHPSPAGDVHRYGGHFAAHLGRCPGLEALGYLPDVARLEWGYHRAFHAEQHPALDARGLGAVQPEDYPRLRLMLQPSARLLESGYPVLRIWQVNQPEWTGDPTVDLAEGRARLLILRQELEVAFIPLGVGEHLWLQGLVHGLTLIEAQQRAAGRDPQFDLGATLQRLLAQGAFSGWQA
jgi:hypothetical protein